MPHKSKGSNGSNGSKGESSGVITLLNNLAIGQFINRIELDNGNVLVFVKWASFENGNATFVTSGIFGGQIVEVPVGKITAILLESLEKNKNVSKDEKTVTVEEPTVMAFLFCPRTANRSFMCCESDWSIRECLIRIAMILQSLII
ncbi:hypothetical protein [Paenibacillus montanisoli]|uniref:Uncharacterized protein n=1 Tax=Paenibacillus montanisoli TaxID=2081970 RepID=A0A328U6X6_9BACL|nr:hypothetical protein [Paenibacillus montanisoli]RAP77151.1 hypothetical protein DL346_01210 [Paenibacillus montanisoli]